MPADAPLPVLFGAPLGVGGLGVQSSNAVVGAIATGAAVLALGPPSAIPGAAVRERLSLRAAPRALPDWVRRFTWLRWRTGQLQEIQDQALGRWAAAEVKSVGPRLCYAFTQVGLEALRWARSEGVVTTVLETPNGHIRDYREVYQAESERWSGHPHRGHPTTAMVARVEEEYGLADWIRVSSRWTRASLVRRGIPESRIVVLEQAVDLARFRPPVTRSTATGPLRLVFVGSLDLRKGFPYLLEALRLAGRDRFRLRIVGATGDRSCRVLFERLRSGVDVTANPGDPVRPLQDGELFVFPTLEDGSPFAVAEAMACGLPVIVSRSCGAAEWVRPGETGWVIPERSVEDLAAALQDALRKRAELPDMGRRARQDTEVRADPAQCAQAVGDWLRSLVNDGE